MDSILGIHEAALTFRAQRMEVIAADLANADTPHYNARDVEFSSVLNGAANAVKMSTTDARHLSTAPRVAQSELKYKSYKVPPGTVHDARTGANGAKVIATYVVEKGKPLATSAP